MLSQINNIVLFIMVISFLSAFMRNRFNKSNIKRISPGNIKVRFSDFEGMDEVKKEI